MKKLLFYALTASLCLASCSEELTQMPTNNADAQKATSFTASLGGEPESRTYVGTRDENNQYPILWSENNAIAVSNGIESAHYVANEGIGESSAKFVAADDAIATSDTYYAFYPATGFNDYENGKFNVTIPAYQTYTEHNFGDNNLPMVAVSNSTNFSFKQIFGGLKIYLFNSDDTDITVSSIRISADEPMSGTATVEYNDGVPTISFSDTDSRNYVNINCTDLTLEANDVSSPPYFYVALPPGTYHNMAVEIITSDNKVKTETVSWDYEITRAKFSPLEISATNAVELPTIDGPTFNSALSTAGALYSCTSIVFETNVTALPADVTIVTDGTVGITYDETNTTATVHIVGPKALLTSGKMMFWGCSSLTSLDLSCLDTSLVTDLSGMFGECGKLTSLNIGNFNTSNATNMQDMFAGCTTLTKLDLSNFNTSNVTNMSMMFNYCPKLSYLNVKSFNTSEVTSMSYMFSQCSCLTTLDLSSFNTSSVTSMNGMFSSCVSLKSLNLSNFDTSNVTNMSGMFSGCDSMSSLDLSNFTIGNTTTVNNIFNTTGANATSNYCEVILPAEAYSYVSSLFESNTKLKYVEAE